MYENERIRTNNYEYLLEKLDKIINLIEDIEMDEKTRDTITDELEDCNEIIKDKLLPYVE